MENLITVKELQEKLSKHENIFILDVRPTDQRKEWKIADSIHVDAYTQLNAGDDTALDIVDVPQDSIVVTVCAAGRTSLLASKLLQRKGVPAYSLEGGMKAWNYAWNKAEIKVDGVKIIQVRTVFGVQAITQQVSVVRMTSGFVFQCSSLSKDYNSLLGLN